MLQIYNRFLFALSLRFEDSFLEKSYQESTLKQQTPLLVMVHTTSLVLLIYDTFLSPYLIYDNYQYLFRGLLFLLGIIGLILYKRFPCQHKYLFILYSFLFNYYICYLQKKLPNMEDFDNFKKGLAMSMFQIGTILSIQHYSLRIFLHLITIVYTIALLKFYSSILLQITCFMFWVLLERLHRNQFKAMKDSEESLVKFKILVSEDLPAGIAVLDLKCEEIKFANKEFFEQVESKESLKAIQIKMNNHLTETITFSNLFDLAFLGDSINHEEYIKSPFSGMLKVNETVKHFEIKLRKIIWQREESIAVILDNVTEKVHLVTVQKVSEYKDQVIAAVSHELRTPINGILGMMDIAILKIMDQEVMKMLKNARSCANLLLSFVNSILDINQIKAQKLKLNITSFKTSEIIEELRSIYAFQASEKKIKFEIECNPRVPKFLITDKNRLLQILINLTTNAFKFTSKGTVSLQITIDNHCEKKICFKITDTGVGIKKEFLSSIFQKFGRIDQEDSKINAQGVGLGLTISNELVRILNDSGEEHIHVESVFGEGSSFSFRLPLMRITETYIKGSSDDKMKDNNNDHVSPFSDRAHKPRYTNGFSALQKLHQSSNVDIKKRVLVVDDIPFNLHVMDLLLKEQNVDKILANSGQEALEWMMREEFDIVFMDLQMPIMDGYEATKLINQKIEEGIIKKTPIIALSAFDLTNINEDVLGKGLADYLTKPIKSGDLKRVFETSYF